MIKFDDPRRWKERADGSMVTEDRAATANLPKDVINPTIAHNDAILDNSRIPPMETIFMASVHKAGRL